MRLLDPAERLADRSPVRWAFDVLVALVAGASALPYYFHDSAHAELAAVPVLGVAVAPLVLRRVFPVPTFVWVLCASVAASVWNEHAVPGLALVIALYTVASVRPRRDAVVAAGVLEVAGIAAAVRLSLNPPREFG